MPNEQEPKPTITYTEGTATHSGWHEFYTLFSKYRDECLKLGQVVLGTDQLRSVDYLRRYVSALYSMAQQVFHFYSEELEKEITNDWLDLLDTINEVIYFAGDKEFKNQILSEGKEFVDRKLKLRLILFYNKLDRLASNAGLLVGKEQKELSEPKKGLLGL